MKINLLTALIFLIFLSCSVSDSTLQIDQETSPTYSLELLKKINQKIARKYLEYTEEKKISIPVGYYGWKDIRSTWNNVPEIGQYRMEFEKADKEFLDFLCLRDERMKDAIEKWKNGTLEKGEWSKTKSIVYPSVRSKYPEDYKRYMSAREEKLRLCNYKTIEFLLDRSLLEDWLFPIDWIPQNQMSSVLSDEFIQSLNDELEGFSVEMIESMPD